jgi:O-acetyl-ADP-ribose deacetylase (regulator of RNase III)
MAGEIKVGGTTVRVAQQDITDFEVDGFVFYAVPDLKLGTGFGTAIQARGGASIRKELEDLAPIDEGEAVVTTGGDMKAKRIVHAVGPQFQDPERKEKLRKTMRNTLACMEKEGMKTVAFPSMGTGFYMIPPDMSAEVMLDTIREHVESGTCIESITICVLDSNQENVFDSALKA